MGRFVEGGDISTLFGAAGQPFRLIQGRVTEWNGTTLANTVTVFGQPRSNLAVLDSAVSGIAVGATVVIAPFGTTFIIVGKIRVPA